MNEEIRKAAQAFPESGRKLPAIVLGASDERPAIHAKIKKLTYHAPSRIGFRVK